MREKKIRINEEQYRRLFEGVDWTADDDSVNIHVNQDMTDKGNKSGALSVDTRAFGSKNDILYGDGSMNANTKALRQMYFDRNEQYSELQKLLTQIPNARNLNDLKWDGFNWSPKLLRKIESVDSLEELKEWLLKTMERIGMDVSVYTNTYRRVDQTPREDKIARYKIGVIPNTDIRFIALFTMSNFNFSDAIKHGTIRGGHQNVADALEDKSGTNKTRVTYDDDRIEPNIAANFSLDNVQQGHYKQSWDYNGKNGYTSIAQFLDKSVLYAHYALKEEGYRPDVIISAPSSSKFNDYYCTNLANKLGVKYIPNFIKRNILNVVIDNVNEDDLVKNGIPQKDIEKFKTQVKNIAYTEISAMALQPIRNLVNRCVDPLSFIPISKSSREKIGFNDVLKFIQYKVAEYIKQTFTNNDVICSNLVQNLIRLNIKNQASWYQDEYVQNMIFTKIGKRNLNAACEEALNIVREHAELIKEKGYKIDTSATAFKITKFDKRFRQYLNNIYVVADEMCNENGQLFKSLANSNFLIFDEDVNSGATLKMVVDALVQKIPNHNTRQIMGLVNAYSSSGR